MCGKELLKLLISMPHYPPSFMVIRLSVMTLTTAYGTQDDGGNDRYEHQRASWVQLPPNLCSVP